ncbi:MAG: TonB-dependent receptor, partial [Pseudomonadota bacterium]
MTARKREETLQDAPLAITAFSEAELQAAGLDDITDFSKATPGLFVESFNSGVNNNARVDTTPRFRGIFLDSGSRLQQTAAVFLDGVAVFGGIQTIGVNELQRVEVTKGPQSALYGRNTFAGAINYVTKDPSDELRFDLDATVATRDEYRIAAGVEGPIIPGVLSFRLAGRFDDVGGHYDNFAVPGEKLGDESQWNINGTVLFTPGDRLRLKVRGSYRELHDGASALIGGAFGPATHNFGGFLLDASCNPIAAAPTVQPSSNTQCSPGVARGADGNPLGEADPFFGRTNSIFRGTIDGGDIPASEIGINTDFSIIEAFRNNVMSDPRFDPATNVLANGLTFSPFEKDDFGLDLEEIRFSANVEYEISDNVTFVALGGYSDEAFGLFTELDLSPDNSFTTFTARDIVDWSIEARLRGTAFSDRLSWAVGGSYVDVEVRELGSTASNLFFPIVFGDGFRTSPFVSGAETWGIFGSLDYELTDTLSVSLEGRYQEDTLISETVNESVPGLSPATITSFLPRATLRYEPSENTTFYVTYSQGNLPGGFNPEVAELDDAALQDVLSRSPTASSVFGEEKLENYEFGWKQSVDGGNGFINLAAFYMQRSDEIFVAIETAPDNRPGAANPRRTVTFSGNGATTDIYGLEIDASWRVSDAFTIGGSVAYIDSEITSFPDAGGTDRFGLVFGPNESPVGQQAPEFPPFSFSLNSTIEQPLSLGAFDTWYLRQDMFYTGTYYTSNANLTEVEQAIDLN